MKRHIPNLITLLNLVCGSMAVVLALEGQWRWAVYALLAAALFDFLDGMAARLLKAYSELGKQLDSLADMVSFGLLPAVFIYEIFTGFYNPGFGLLASIAIVPSCAAIRLARYNLQEDQTFFSGLPAPAHALFWTGLFWLMMDEGSLFGQDVPMIFLWGIMLLMALHMIVPVPMYSLKFTSLRIRGNLMRYILLLVSAGILILIGPGGLSLVILTYILLSLLNFLLQMRVSN